MVEARPFLGSLQPGWSAQMGESKVINITFHSTAMLGGSDVTGKNVCVCVCVCVALLLYFYSCGDTDLNALCNWGLWEEWGPKPWFLYLYSLCVCVCICVCCFALVFLLLWGHRPKCTMQLGTSGRVGTKTMVFCMCIVCVYVCVALLLYFYPCGDTDLYALCNWGLREEWGPKPWFLYLYSLCVCVCMCVCVCVYVCVALLLYFYPCGDTDLNALCNWGLREEWGPKPWFLYLYSLCVCVCVCIALLLYFYPCGDTDLYALCNWGLREEWGPKPWFLYLYSLCVCVCVCVLLCSCISTLVGTQT